MVLVGVAVAVTEETERQKSESLLAAFTAAALGLPGMVSAQGIDLMPQNLGIDSSYSNYQESNGRMSVQAFQNDANLQWSDSVNFRVNSTLDYIGGGTNPMNQNLVGGASPVFYWGSHNYYGKRYGSMELSQATHGPYKGQQGGIFDQRLAMNGKLNVRLNDLSFDVTGGNSTEWDYISNYVNLDSRWEINNKMTTLAAGFGYAKDNIWADGGQQGLIHEQYTNGQYIGGNKNTLQGLLGVTQILDKESLLQLNLTVSNSSGFLSDPYKSVWVDNVPNFGFSGINNNCRQSTHFAFQSNFCADTRPGARTQTSVLMRYVRNFSALDAAALHLDYRFYSDTWDIDSHTFEASWMQPLPYQFMLTPHVRYYTQGSAYFYQTVYANPTANGLYSSDYRLANFGAIAGGVHLNKALIENITVGAGVELYQRTHGMGFMGGTGSTVDNFNFTLYSLNLDIRI